MAAYDIVGGNDGMVIGATLTTDRFGNANSAYSFVNASDNVYLGNGILLNVGSVSVEAWVKPNTNGGAIAVRGGFSVDWGFSLGVNTTNGFSFSTHTTPTDNSIDSGVFHTVGQYYHVVGVFNSAGSMQLYVNGALVGSRTCGTSTRTNGTIGWTIGNGNSPSGFPVGVVDSFNIYYSSLSASQVKVLYELSSKQYLLPFV